MNHEYFLHDWITQMDHKKELWFTSEKKKKSAKELDVELKFDAVVNTILELIKEYIKHREQVLLPITIHITCLQQEDNEDHVICDFRVISTNANKEEPKFFRCLSHIAKQSLNHIFTPGMVWVATELKQTIKLTLDPSL